MKGRPAGSNRSASNHGKHAMGVTHNSIFGPPQIRLVRRRMFMRSNPRSINPIEFPSQLRNPPANPGQKRATWPEYINAEETPTKSAKYRGRGARNHLAPAPSRHSKSDSGFDRSLPQNRPPCLSVGTRTSGAVPRWWFHAYRRPSRSGGLLDLIGAGLGQLPSTAFRRARGAPSNSLASSGRFPATAPAYWRVALKKRRT
jgi:hypothetical protein